MFRRAIVRSEMIECSRLSRVVIGALTMMAVTRLVPVTFVQFYLQGIAAVVALWPLALQIWRASGQRVATQQRALPAT
jgi:hypothetical protein